MFSNIFFHSSPNPLGPSEPKRDILVLGFPKGLYSVYSLFLVSCWKYCPPVRNPDHNRNVCWSLSPNCRHKGHAHNTHLFLNVLSFSTRNKLQPLKPQPLVHCCVQGSQTRDMVSKTHGDRILRSTGLVMRSHIGDQSSLD